MRILPTALFHEGDLSFAPVYHVDKVYEISALTHGHARSKLGCLIYAKIIADIIHKPDEDKLVIVKDGLKVLATYLQKEEQDEEIRAEYATYNRLWNIATFVDIPREQIKSSGYVVDTLEAAIWCFLTTGAYKECVLKAVNLGDDTDTVGAVAGGLAGVYYGLEQIPEEWQGIIPRRDWIMDLAGKMYNRKAME